MKDNELSREEFADASAEEIIDWARHNYYASSEQCRKLLSNLESDDPHIIANKYNILGILDMYDSEYYSCISNLKKALIIAENLDHNELRAKIYLNLSSVNERLENLPEAIHYAKSVFSTGQSKMYGSTYNNLARMNFRLGNMEAAHGYLEESINAYNSQKDPSVFHGYFLKSEILKKSGKYEEALESYKFILEFLATTPLSSFEAATLNEIGHTYLVLGKPEEGIPYIERGIEAAIKYNISRDETLGHLRLAECYTALKDYKKADKHVDVFLKDKNEKEGTGAYYRLANEIRIKNYKESNDERLSSAYDHYIEYLTTVEIDNSKKLHRKYLESKESEIKEIRNKAEALDNQNEELRYISKLLAHDLKTPVRTIGSFNSLLKKENIEFYNEESKEYFEFISKGTKEIYAKLDLTESYLNLKINNKKNEVSLNDLIEEVKSNYFNEAIDMTIIGEIIIDSADVLLLKKAIHILLHNYKSLAKSKPIALNINCDNSKKHLRITDSEGLSLQEKNWKRNIFNTGNEEISEGFSFFTKIIMLHNGKLDINSSEKSLEISFGA